MSHLSSFSTQHDLWNIGILEPEIKVYMYQQNVKKTPNKATNMLKICTEGPDLLPMKKAVDLWSNTIAMRILSSYSPLIFPYSLNPPLAVL